MRIKELLKKNLFNLFIIVFIFLLDRISKYLVLELFYKTSEKEVIITSFLSFNLLWNEGIAFGLFSFDEKVLYNILTFLIGLVIFIIFFMLRTNEGLKKYSLLIILGGAIGNFYDRIKYNAVPDFIDFHIENFHWFIFNVSDIFITIGVILMIVLELISNKKENRNEKN